MDTEKLNNELTQNNDEKKRKAIIILILAILTLIVALIGASFAYFTSSVRNVNGNQSFVMSTATIEGATYSSSKNITILDAMPGVSDETVFTITNPNSSATIRYSLKLIADYNNFTNEDGDGQLLITISGGNLKEPIVLDFTDGINKKEEIILSNATLSSSKSDVYNLKVEFVDIGKSQDSNIEKSFIGHIEINQSIAVSTNAEQ